MQEKKSIVITCPTCGCEYLPGEIYLPKAFLGQPRDIDKKYDTGQVMNYSGDSMNLEEHFICEKCLTPFKVMAKVSFNTVEESLYDFNNDYVSKLKKESLFLDES